MRADPTDEHLRSRFPDLYAPAYWDWGGVDVEFTVERPPPELVSNVHLVARCHGRLVVSVTDHGWRVLPGGTREPGESVEQSAARELTEETGATLAGPLAWIGAYRARHRRPAPLLPHLPHPLSFWLFAAADVTLNGPPTNPPGGEHVIDVLLLPPAEAAGFVTDPRAGDVVRLAMNLGLV